MKQVVVKEFQSYPKTVPLLLEEINFKNKIKNAKRILLKPNLTTLRNPPSTTPVGLVEEIIKFIKTQTNTNAEIIVAEGAGGCDTEKAFRGLGYYRLEEEYKVKLIDLNKAERIEKKILGH